MDKKTIKTLDDTIECVAEILRRVCKEPNVEYVEKIAKALAELVSARTEVDNYYR